MNIDRLPPEGIDELPTKLWPFIWFFVRQMKSLIFAMASVQAAAGIVISLMFWYVGELVGQGAYTAAMLWGGFAILISGFWVFTAERIFHLLVFMPHVGNLIRRQLYWYTVRQSLSFFQDDFSGRIANKLLQSAPSLRDVVGSVIGAVWFAAIFTISNVWFLWNITIWLALPLIVWLVLYALTLVYFVPKVQRRSAAHGEDMSMLTGQVVDSFTNFLPIKYFARIDYEDRRVVSLLQQHSQSFRASTMMVWWMSFVIEVWNVLLLIATGLVGYHLINTQGQEGVAAMAMALPMVLQATFHSGWIMWEVSGIFENLGTVQEGIETLTKPHGLVDKDKAKDLDVGQKAPSILYRDVAFSYGQADKPVLDGFTLDIPAGQKVGLVGRSGAGKSTITSLIVRAHDVEGGEILINGHNIADVTQDSVRRNITVITQESYLFHRSILDNIRYGKPDATMEEVIAAAEKASAHEFIVGQEDANGRKGYEAHVGERGVKLSGGQKQRVGIARAVLKDAPILILDEATSALDSESEHAIQTALESIMEDKTVIAIAHRLSTLRQMDRIIVMEAGRIVEDGTHDELIAKSGGHYAKLWQMQSGGFLQEE